MHPDVAALVSRHQLSDAAAREVEALLLGGGSAHTALFDDFAPVTLPSLDDDESWASGDFETTDEHPMVAGRYQDLGRIAVGGMGEVRRVLDRHLNRPLAMKLLHGRLMGHPSAVARFAEEAQATAQLQHPGIVPVHDLGKLPDGRVWFTMKEVVGRPFSEMITEVHSGQSAWTLKRLVGALRQVAQAVAYAHDRGVVHRDLKPQNVMIGDHGEVLVVDWGLARILGRPDDALADVVETQRSISGSTPTQLGSVAGTPAYMPPEQARGEAVDARADIYSLGAMLYQILAGRMPYGGRARDVLTQVLAGPPPSPPGPPELVDLCERAMARTPDVRPQRAGDLADALGDWLDGAHRTEQALQVVERAEAHLPEAAALSARADALQTQAQQGLDGIAAWQPESDKAPHWALEDQARQLRREAALKDLEADQRLQAALQLAPTLPEAHALLATRYRDRHARAEARGDVDGTALAEAQTRHHLQALPEDHPVAAECRHYLTGDGALTLVTDPPDADVRLYRYEVQNRRLVAVYERTLGSTPLHEVRLPMGSYLCLIRHPDRADVRYPVHISRHHHHDGVAPGQAQATPIWLPPNGFFGADEVYVPAGWFRSGSRAAARALPERQLWCDAVVFARHPVTNAQYLAFLDALVTDGREEEALRYVPRERAAREGGLGAMIYGRTDAGFVLQPDVDGDLWQPDWPVMMVDWLGAQAYLQWWSAQTGRAWRLPAELEWEKAARGVDGRRYPWGDFHDPSWSCMDRSHPDAQLPTGVEQFAVDESPYGVRGMAGNVRDFCADAYQRDGPAVPDRRVLPAQPLGEVTGSTMVAVRGGSWLSTPTGCLVGDRIDSSALNRDAVIGFRGVWSVRPGPR